VLQSLTVILFDVFLALLLSWAYFRRYRINRPPIGVMNTLDVALMLGAIILIPIFYMLFPAWVMSCFLIVAGLGGLYILLEVILPTRLLTWLAILLVAVADLWSLPYFERASHSFLVINNIVQILLVISITNLWAQSGMKASAVVILGLALMIYDFVFTALLPFMGDLFSQLQYVPFSPMIAWRTGIGDQWVAIGFGDVSMASVFPLVMLKAYGKEAGLVALLFAFCAFISVASLSFTSLIRETFPLMVVLGPIMAVQYLFWRKRRGKERTTRAYLQAEL
jgi:hypothetical protein